MDAMGAMNAVCLSLLVVMAWAGYPGAAFGLAFCAGVTALTALCLVVAEQLYGDHEPKPMSLEGIWGPGH